MRIINAEVLVAARRKHPQASAWVDAWEAAVLQAQWRSIMDVRKSFPSADGGVLDTGVVITVFNVRGNKFRLLTAISYRLELVTVVGLLTHAEYDKDRWKGTL